MPVISHDLTCKKHYNVIVAGGGTAGCAAAVQAAKCGLSVLLLEKKCLLGGLATGGLVNFMEPLCDGRGNTVIHGFAEKWTKALLDISYDSLPEIWRDGNPEHKTGRRYATRFSANTFALLLTDELQANGVDFLFDCSVTDAVMDGNVCRGVVIYGKAGFEYYECDMLIDTTGDCDALRRAGVPTVSGQNYFIYYGHAVTLENCKKAVEANDIGQALSWFYGGTVNLFGHNQPEDIPRWSGLSPEDVTDYIKRNHAIMFQKIKNTEKAAGDVVVLPDMPQFRTTCHIAGDYTFTEQDAYRHFDDSVCLMNDFERKEYLYELPLRCLTNRNYPNIITAGRSVSSAGYGWDITRVIPIAIITGQAAAVVCANALRDKKPVWNCDIKAVQNELEANQVAVHY